MAVPTQFYGEPPQISNSRGKLTNIASPVTCSPRWTSVSDYPRSQSSRVLCHCKNLKTSMDTLVPLRYPFLCHRPERALQTWSRTYGPLFSVWMGNRLCCNSQGILHKCQPILLGRSITVTPYTVVINRKLQESDVRC